MPRRRRGGVIDAMSDGREVEILDLDASGLGVVDEVVVSDAEDSPSLLAILGGLVVAGCALFGVVTAGNTPAPEPPAPSITVPQEPVSAEEAARAAEIAELEATYGVHIGDGPDLNWRQVVWNIDVNQFQWIDDGFVGHNREIEWTIRPTMIGPSVSQRESLEITSPGYRVQLVDGARLLIPESDPSDHLLVVVADRDPIRFDLPDSSLTPSTELVRPVRSWWDASIIDEQLVIVGSQHLEVDLEVLGTRSGRDLSAFDYVAIGGDQIVPREVPHIPGLDVEPIRFDDVGFTEAELADLALLDNQPGGSEAFSMGLSSGVVERIQLDDLDWASTVSRTESGAALMWSDRSAQQWLSTSTDGHIWSTRPISVDEGSLWFSKSRMYTFPVGGPSSIRRSGDLGSTWQRTRRPFGSSFDNLAADDLLIVTEGTQAIVGNEPAVIVTDDFELTIIGVGRALELRDIGTGELSTTGIIDDASAAFDPLGGGVSIIDPESGEVLVSIPYGALVRAHAEANGVEPPGIAIARWAPDADDPEWRIQPIDEVFNDALEVDFAVGGGHVLAVVTTPRGYDYYLASTE